jgi:hypothetical protein
MKIATRYLLTTEILMACMMLSWGMSGWLWHGALSHALKQDGENATWGLALCGIGGLHLALSVGEWLFGQDWGNRALLISVRLRFWLAFVSMAAWIYVCYFMFTLHGAEMVFSLSFQAPIAVLFSVGVAIGNRKIALVLDPNVPTQRLQREILAKREKLIGNY